MTELPTELLPPHNIPYRLKLLTLLNERKLLTVLEPHNLTPMQYGVLCCLWQQDGRVTSEISESLKALGGTLTCVLDGLESRSLVERVKDSHDRRVLRVYLTKDGKALKNKVVPKVIKLHGELLQPLSDEECRQFSKMLDKLLADLSGL